MVKLPDAVDTSIEGGFTAQMRIDAKPGPQTKKIQALHSTTLLVQRTAASVGLKTALCLAQADEVAFGIF